MLVEKILERNRAFVAGRTPQPLPPVEKMPLAVVACYDPRLDPLIEPSLGLSPGDAFVLRAAGALVRPDGSNLRSLTLAVYLFGVEEILVVGHTSCRMAAFDASGFIDAFRSRGVSREAFGTRDLRAWAGAMASPRQGVLDSVATIREASVLPDDLAVWGTILDDASGALQVVVRPESPVERAAAESRKPSTEASGSEAGSAPSEESAGAADTADRGSNGEGQGLAQAAEAFVRTLKSHSRWRYEIGRLREELRKPSSPLTKFQVLESFAQRLGADSSEVLTAFGQLRNELVAQRGDLDSQQVGQLLRRLAGRL